MRLVDKRLPQMAWLAPEHTAACSQNFVQADASREQSHPRVFDLPPRPDGSPREFDYVINCGGETRYSQDDEVYKLRSYELSLAVGRAAALRGARAFVEAGTGSVYTPHRTPQKEGAKTKPHTKKARWKLKAEEELTRIPALRLCVLRLPHVYGPYNNRWLGTQLALARVYQSREPRETMKWLWSSELCANTLHVEDAARALWAAAVWRARQPNALPPSPPDPPGVFNVVDRGATTQGVMADIIAQVFAIPTGFQNPLVNAWARVNLERVVDDLNDDTLDEWADLLARAGVRDQGGPLNPFMEKELLKDADLSLDGSRFENVVGWRSVFCSRVRHVGPPLTPQTSPRAHRSPRGRGRH